MEFTAVEHASVLWGVNGTTFEELDLDAALSSTAAQSIIDNAPYASIEELAAAPYVGKATLLALRGYSPVWSDISALAHVRRRQSWPRAATRSSTRHATYDS